MSDPILNNLLREEALLKLKKGLVFYDKPIIENNLRKTYKISICTTCMNRIDDLKQTLVKNIKDNSDYNKLEFVVLNYNSTDNLDNFMRTEMINYIEKGKVNYYHTKEPKYYSMTHSRNIAFKLAKGDIVTNVDADHFTHKGFAAYLNIIANQGIKNPMFIKSRQKNRGRVGFFKKQWIKKLGGYNEDIKGYGFDDEDLRLRATALGFITLRFGGEYFSHTEDHKRHPIDNYENKDWRYSQRLNTLISLLNIEGGYLKANKGRHWGKAKLIKNFKEEIEI